MIIYWIVHWILSVASKSIFQVTFKVSIFKGFYRFAALRKFVNFSGWMKPDFVATSKFQFTVISFNIEIVTRESNFQNIISQFFFASIVTEKSNYINIRPTNIFSIWYCNFKVKIRTQRPFCSIFIHFCSCILFTALQCRDDAVKMLSWF